MWPGWTLQGTMPSRQAEATTKALPHLQGRSLEEQYPQGHRFQGSETQTQDEDLQGPGLPTLASVLMTTREPRVTLTRRGHPVKFLQDTEATFSTILCNAGPPSTKSATKGDISGKPITKFFTQQLSCNWDSLLFSHVYIYMSSVVSASLTQRPHGLQPSRLLCPRDFPGKNTGGGCHFLLQGISPIQGSNLDLLQLPALAG